jgi:Holliday junction resolvase RusA-like endonuclease
MSEQPAVIVTIPTPPSLNKLWVTAPGKPRVRSSEYRAWAERAGWLLRMQIVGMAPLDCRFNLDIEVPISRRDTGNHEKALCDLCESCGVVTNDGNAHRISVTPTERTDCLLVFTPLPEMGAVRQAPKGARPRARPVMRRTAPKRRALTWLAPGKLPA